jgi:uncharacterized repeat protein (TIGR01451 family)
VAVAGDTLTYTLLLHNGGSAAATGISIWDSLPPNVSLIASAPAGAAFNAGVLSWNWPSLSSAATQGFTFSAAFLGSGSQINNQAEAAASNNPQVQSNLNMVAVGATFTGTPTLTPSPTLTASPTPTPTVTIVLSAPNLVFTLARDPVNPGLTWPTQGFNNIGFIMTFKSLSGCACAIAPDLYLTFEGDTSHLTNPEIDPVEGMLPIGLAPYHSVLTNYYWTQLSPISNNNIETGAFGLAPGYTLSREIFAQVNNTYLNQTITSAAFLSSASYGIGLTATVSTYIYAVQPTPTPIPVQAQPTATPIAGLGQIVAYPQPASSTICFTYEAPTAGKIDIDVYNAAFQLVAHFRDDAPGGTLGQTCVPVSRLSTGVYIYKASVAGFNFPTSEFGVAR